MSPLRSIPALTWAAASLAAASDRFESDIRPYLRDHCAQCHGEAVAMRDVRLDGLHAPGAVAGERDIWTAVLDQLSLGAMPPRPLPRPDSARAEAVLAALRAALGLTDALDAAERPGYGNYVDHEALFGGELPTAAIAATPARLWRMNPHAFKEFVNTLSGRPLLVAKLNQGGDGMHPSLPFVTPPHEFRDFANVHSFEEATAELLMNMLWLVAGYQLENPKAPVELRAPLSADRPAAADYETAIRAQYRLVLQREPRADEVERLAALAARAERDSGRRLALQTVLTAVLLAPETVFRFELGRPAGDADGRRRLDDREIAWALAYALTDRPPDGELQAALAAGRLSARPGVEEEARRMLARGPAANPRLLRFFQEYFEYTRAPDVFKTGRLIKHIMAREMALDADAVVLHILREDRDVLRRLLTTDEFFVNYNPDNPEKQLVNRPDQRQKWYYELYNLPREWQWTADQPVKMPEGQRMGMLTHPAWLLTFSDADKNQAIQRGRWIRTKLLGGTVSDAPIGVAAQLPEDPARTLRERMSVTRQAQCWSCHSKMDDLGLPFERYGLVGEHRDAEAGRPVDASGRIDAGLAELDGPVASPFEMIERLAGAERVRQVVVRHAFRFWLGRNETLADAQTLRDADRAYVDSGGSMKALVASLLASDAFLFRRPMPPASD